jgi:predicted O-methyltransferase YrrM
LSRLWALKPFCEKEGIKTVLEFGTDTGFGSTYAFLEAGCFVITVDLLENFQNDSSRKSLIPSMNPFLPRLVRFICDDITLPLSNDQKFDMVFIDTNHSYESTKLEIEFAKKHASRFIGFDDISLEGVAKAIKEFGLEIEVIGEELGVYRVK